MYFYMRLFQTRFFLDLLCSLSFAAHITSADFPLERGLTQSLLRTPSNLAPATNSTITLTHMLHTTTTHLPFLGLLPHQASILLSRMVISTPNTA